jgi:Protein of unknown function (DUF3489)
VHEMLYVTREGRIASAIDNLPLGDGPAFASEDEFQKIAGRWPMQRLVAIWNGLPGLQPVRRFENRRIAIARIWRALPAGLGQGSGSKLRRASSRKRIAFREQSKAAQVCDLLRRPEGATLTEITTLTGWQRHTVRGFVSASVRKQANLRTFERNGERAYHLKG